MSFTLILDTSTERAAFGLARGEEIFFQQFLPVGIKSSQHITSTIFEGFKELSITPKDLKALGVATGPGLFTGIRVGVAFAKGIACSLDLPLIGFSSLEGFVHHEKGDFISVIDARIQGAYILQQRREKDGSVTCIGKPKLISLEELYAFGPALYVGPCFERLGLKNSIESNPDLSHLAKLVEYRFSHQLYSPDEGLELLYLRSPV